MPAALIGTLARCAWVAAGQPLCLIGDSGTGKSHLLIGLGTAAAENGYRVRYVTAAALVNELVEAADDRTLSRAIARYGRVDLLCLDELGYIELDRRGAELLFQVFTEREEKRLHRDRVQRRVQRVDAGLHRPPAVRRHRRPAHLRRPHHHDRHRLLPAPHHRRPPPGRRERRTAQGEKAPRHDADQPSRQRPADGPRLPRRRQRPRHRLMLADAHAVLDGLASGGAAPAAARQAAALLADADSPYDLQGLAGAVGETVNMLYRANRDALAGVPARIPGA